MTTGPASLLQGMEKKSPAQRFRLGARGAAAVIAVSSLIGLIADFRWGATFTELSQSAPLGLLGGAVALLLLAPPDDARDTPGRVLRTLGMLAALVPLLVVAQHLRLPHLAVAYRLANIWALCFVFLSASLLLKPWLRRTGVGFDIFNGFVGCLVVLINVFGLPNAGRGQPTMSLSIGLGVFGLSAAWLAAFPRRRPVAFFVEDGSAAAVLRRSLPLTFAFPVLIVSLAVVRQHNTRLAQIGNWVVLSLLVGFGAWLFGTIANTLDRMDAVRFAAELELRSAAERYRKLFENNPQPLWLLDGDTLRFIGVNDAACKLYGYSREEFLQLSAADLRRGAGIEGAREQWLESAAGSAGLYRHCTKDGGALDVEITSHRTDWQGNIWVCYGHNVTNHLAALEKLRASEAQVRILLESVSEGILAVNLDGEIVWCNPAAARITGWPAAEQLLGRSAHVLWHHSFPDGAPMPPEACSMVQSVRTGVPFSGEVVLWRADGAAFPAEIRCSPLYRDGQLTGSIVTFADVTERNRLSAQFQQAQKMEAVGRLAAGIAHDFNNLLTVINGYAEMLAKRPDSPDAPNRVAHILTAGQRAAELTRQLLAFSRQQVLQPQMLDLKTVLAEMEPLLRRLLGEDVTLSIELAGDLGRVQADPGQIGQVLMNLVVNARDAMPDGGHLTIECANVALDAAFSALHPEVAPGAYVMLAVTDTGCGMDSHTMAHAFEPFFTTKAPGQGTGLGLAMVFGVVRQSGGTITVYSEPGHGTSFKVYLPCVGEVASADAAAAAAEPTAPRGRERVLVIEDEQDVRDLVREVLEDRGYTVAVATLPDEALALQASLGPLDLLITDIVMPGMDGRRLAEKLSALRPGLRVLYISGYPDKAVSRNGNLEPGLAFIQKPFTPEALARKVREVLDTGIERVFGASAS